MLISLTEVGIKQVQMVPIFPSLRSSALQAMTGLLVSLTLARISELQLCMFCCLLYMKPWPPD